MSQGRMSFRTIRYEVEHRIATITFERPDQLNALSPEMISELRRAYTASETDDDVWITIVTGNGRAFCAGAVSLGSAVLSPSTGGCSASATSDMQSPWCSGLDRRAHRS